MTSLPGGHRSDNVSAPFARIPVNPGAFLCEVVMEENFKEFQGKDLDSAIAEACEYFDAPREKLEIEILQDAKSGIFGIVGARKARLRARRAQLRETVRTILSQGTEAPAAGADSPARARPGKKRKPQRQESPVCGQEPIERDAAAGDGASEEEARLAGAQDASVPPSPVPSDDAPDADALKTAEGDESDEGTETATPVAPLDEERVRGAIDRAVRELTRPIVGPAVRIDIAFDSGKARASIDCEEDPGLLIGREGQTMAALQYLVSRIVSRDMGCAVFVQLDVSEYRRQQEDKLREIALALAEKVRRSGRSCSTRPLSSYNRRIVHLCLRDAEDVQTRSIGEGPLKRVVIARRRPERGER